MNTPADIPISPDGRPATAEGAYTVLELMVSTVILAMLSSMLFFALNEVTRATANSLGKAEIYQESRTVIDQMSRELQQAIPCVVKISGTPNDIFLAQSSDTLGTPAELHFVAVIDNNRGFEEAEVHYYWDGTNTLYKNLTFFDPTNEFTGATENWDFNSVLATSPGWQDTPPLPTGGTSKYVPVLDGVRALTFQMWTNSPPDDANYSVDSWSVKSNMIPAYVRVQITAYDANVMRRWKSAELVGAAQTNLARTFSFLVYLPRNEE